MARVVTIAAPYVLMKLRYNAPAVKGEVRITSFAKLGGVILFSLIGLNTGPEHSDNARHRRVPHSHNIESVSEPAPKAIYLLAAQSQLAVVQMHFSSGR